MAVKTRRTKATDPVVTPAAESPFSAWMIEDVRDLVDDEIDDTIEANELFVAGDHWQEGEGWVGPHPNVGEDGYEETMSEIEAAFVSRNVIGEVVERHASFILGSHPRWGLVPRRPLEEKEEPTSEEQGLIDEAEAALTVWWDARRAHEVMLDLARTVLWARRSALRLYVPKGKLARVAKGNRETTVIPRAATLGEALGKLWPEHPNYNRATVVEDDDTKEQCGVFLFESETEDRTAELAELSYVEGETTVIAIIGGERREAFKLKLGGRLPMYEIKRPLLITDQIQRSQRALNLAASMLPRNVVTGGFLERVLLNAQLPGVWQTDERGEKIRFIPDDMAVGAGTTNALVGVEVTDEQGKRTLTTPDVKWREPVAVTPSIDAKQEHYRDILEEAKQGHIITGADSKIGWKSRKQLRADSDKALGLTKAPVEAAGRWLLETALAMAEAFMGTPGKYTSVLRADFICLASSGPIEMDEAQDNRNAAKDGFLSRATAMERNGVDDVDAELGRIAAEPGARVDQAAKQAGAIKTLTDAGADVRGAAEYIGAEPDRARLLVGTDRPDPEPAE